jgi:hypothetical protein
LSSSSARPQKKPGSISACSLQTTACRHMSDQCH